MSEQRLQVLCDTEDTPLLCAAIVRPKILLLPPNVGVGAPLKGVDGTEQERAGACENVQPDQANSSQSLPTDTQHTRHNPPPPPCSYAKSLSGR